MNLIIKLFPVQASSNYINSDEDLKQQFDHALSNARKVLAKENGKNLDEIQIEGLKQVIEDTKDAFKWYPTFIKS